MFNDLIEELHNKGLQVCAYADDLAIIGKDKEKLEEAITIVQNWTDKNRIKINKKKSGIIFYKRKLSKNSENNANIMGFPIVKIYKYLGIWIDEKMNFTK